MKVGALDLSLKQFQKAIEDRLAQISYNLVVGGPTEKISQKIIDMRESLYTVPTQEEDTIYGNIIDITT